MVSTRQSSNVGGGGECSGTVSDPGLGKSLRHGNIPPPSAPEPSCSGTLAVVEPTQTINFLDLPPEIVMKIMGYLNYRNITQLRPVCRRIDSYCCSILNSTFQRLQTQMLLRFQSIKAKMPRRESARRNHPLACESDIVETLHMRLTLLQMTFGKHIERKHCCFFAGEILDEVYRILHYIKVTQKLIRPYKVTDELFDLSTMAMEYFKEHVEPTLPEIAYFGTDFLDFTGAFVPTSSNKPAYLCLESPPHSATKGDESPSHQILSGTEDRSPEPLPQPNMVLRKRIRKIKQGMKRYNSQLTLMRRDLRNCKGKLAEQQKQILEYASRLDENDKKNEETSRKFSTLLQVDTIGLGPQSVYLELNKCKTELQYWRSKSPATHPVCIGCGKVMAPGPSEELQALANPGALSLELDFADPTAGTSSNEPDWGLQQWTEGAAKGPQQCGEAEGKVIKRKGAEDGAQQDVEPKKLRRMRSKRSKVWSVGTPRSKI